MTPSSQSISVALIKWSKPGIIYVARNRVNGLRYVGQSTKFIKRKWQHKTSQWKGTRSILTRAIQKYGFESFDFTIVQECFDRSTLNAAEAWWIDSLNTVHPNGYNSRRAGDYRPSNFPQTPRRGWEHTEEAKAKMSSSRKGRQLSDEHKKHIAESGKGRQVSAETRRKFSEARKGCKMPPHSEETKRRMSEAHKGKPKSEEHRRKIAESNKGKHYGNRNLKGVPHLKARGQKKSEETRAKMSAWQKGRKHPWMIGNAFNKEWREKQKQARNKDQKGLNFD